MTAAGARVLPFVRRSVVDDVVVEDVVDVVVEDVAVSAAEEASLVASSPQLQLQAQPPAVPVSPAVLSSVDLVLPLRLGPTVAVLSGVAGPPAVALLAWVATGSPGVMVATGCTALAAVVTVDVAGPRIVRAVSALPWVGGWVQ